MEIDDIKKIDEFGISNIFKKAEGLSVEEFELKYSKEKGFPCSFAAEQIHCYKRGRKKIPEVIKKGFLLTKKSYEQSSSQATALYKKRRLKGERFIDLTGGLGIDFSYISSCFSEAYYCELSDFLCALFKRNSKRLGVTGKIFNGDGLKYLAGFEDGYFSWGFVDPSRRIEGKRVIALSDCEPKVTCNMKLLLDKCSNLCIKASPAYDLTIAVKEIEGLYEIVVLSYNGEVREILLFASKKEKKKIVIKSVIIDHDGSILHEIEAPLGAEENSSPEKSGKYFYVPDPSIFKTGLYGVLAKENKLWLINKFIGYLSGDRVVDNFPGKIYEVQNIISWNRKNVKKYLQDYKIVSASIAKRGFPIDVARLKKMLALKDGGVDYLFFTKDLKGNKICIHCLKK